MGSSQPKPYGWWLVFLLAGLACASPVEPTAATFEGSWVGVFHGTALRYEFRRPIPDTTTSFYAPLNKRLTFFILDIYENQASPQVQFAFIDLPRLYWSTGAVASLEGGRLRIVGDRIEPFVLTRQ